MKNVTKILWGMVLIVVGLIVGLNSLGITDINLFFNGWWTLFIIVPSFISIFKGEDFSGGLLGLGIGVLLLLAAQDIISYRIIAKLILPAILVAIGFSIVWGEIFGAQVKEKVSKAKVNEMDALAAILKEEIRTLDKEFKGANVDAVFGHAVLDIRKVKISDEAVIKASAVFGSVDIMVPSDVVVKMKATKVLGDVSKTHVDGDAKNEKVIYIDAFSMFGGINIK